MNKIKITSVIVAVFAIAATIFWACSKDNQDTTFQAPNDYLEEIDIDKLMAETGIDIYALSELSSLQEASIMPTRQVEALAYGKFDNKKVLTDALVTEVSILNDAIQNAVRKNDYDTFFKLFEQLYTLTESIDGISFTSHSTGLQVVEVDTNKYNFPVTHIENNVKLSNAILGEITVAAPTFPTLSVNTQVQVISACLSLNVGRNLNFMKTASSGPKNFAECKKQATNQLVWDIAGNTAVLIATSALCAGTLWFILACEGAATAAYIRECVKDNRTCDIAIENCRYKFPQ